MSLQTLQTGFQELDVRSRKSAKELVECREKIGSQDSLIEQLRRDVSDQRSQREDADRRLADAEQLVVNHALSKRKPDCAA